MSGRSGPEWRVAAGLIQSDGLLLLVANRRRGGRLEWTPPGGVVDRGETTLGALGREVREETGLTVASWSPTVYAVSVDFVDRGMHLGVEVFMAEEWLGSMSFQDPDGIVEDGRFVAAGEGRELLATAPTWVSEPVGTWLSGEVGPGQCFAYRAHGTRPDDMRVERL